MNLLVYKHISIITHIISMDNIYNISILFIIMADSGETNEMIKIDSSKRFIELIILSFICVVGFIFLIYYIYNNFLLQANNNFSLINYYLLIILTFIMIIIFIIAIIQVTPIELYKNGLKPLNSKIFIILKLHENFIHFKDVKELMILRRSVINGIGFLIILRNDKKIFQFVDTSKDYKKIINMYKKFKSQVK